MIKSFYQKLEEEKLNEASLQGNPAIPGEGGKTGSYLADVEREVAQRNAEFQRRFGRDIPQFMSFVTEVREMQRGHEKELEALAERGIRLFYGDILGETTLKIRFPKSDEIKKMAEKVPSEPPESITLKTLEDEDIISRIHVRKIQNNITQGEAKNVKAILNLTEVYQGFVEIFGTAGADRYKELLNKITEIAKFFDWAIPIEVQKEMWQRDKSGFSGSVSVSWDEPEEKEDAEQKAKDLVDELIRGSEIPDQDAEDLFDQMTPTINAIGTDFSMLIHETVKGIYELIIAAAIPDEPEVAEAVMMNTDTLADELEDLRYGPEIAGDLRDFLNEFPESDKVPNFREKVFGKMVAISKDDPKAFLDLMFKILNADPTDEASEAKLAIKKLAKEVGQEWEDYLKARAEYDMELEPEEEYDSEEPEEEQDQETEVNYDDLSKKEIQALIDQALEDRDFEKVRELSAWLKESDQSKLYEKVMAVHGYHG